MVQDLAAADPARQDDLQKALDVWRVHLVKLICIEVLDEREGVGLGDVCVEADLFFGLRPAWGTSGEHDVKDDA